MAKKVNADIRGYQYCRVRAVLGSDRSGNPIVKSFYGKSKREAVYKRDKFMQEHALGMDHIKMKETLCRSMHVWIWEILRFSGIKDSTFETYESIYRVHIENGSLGHTRLEDLQKINVQQYYNELHDKGKSYSRIKNINKILNMFFKYCVSEGYLLRNPCYGLKLDVYKEKKTVEDLDNFFEDEGTVETFSNEEIPILLNGIVNPKLRILVKFALGTGLRQGEILALKKSDIRDGFVQVTKSLRTARKYNSDGSYHYACEITPPKTKNSARRVPIPTELRKDLNELSKLVAIEKLKLGECYTDNDLLFPSETGTYMDSRNLIRSWKRAFNHIDVPYRKFHSLRHTYATQLIKNGSQLITVSRLLGHGSIKTTEIYAHVLDRTKQNDVQSLNAFFS